ncbi:hypothetical protein, unlikely [Trypanosoma congolense IL3000]|uniref:Uncharacterized protein n=1 Tax=Trypanosoma congolense (strain IL3000) TaxID=1068625 RepID=F9WD82_TRYCI|nr:hypothetical protein, unlikely [Trypanosoma congolense IL3000]
MNEYSLPNPVHCHMKMNCSEISKGGNELLRERVVYYQRIIEQSSLNNKPYSHTMEIWHPPSHNQSPIGECLSLPPDTFSPIHRWSILTLHKFILMGNNFKLTLSDNHRECILGGMDLVSVRD